ncbi:MAG TPA: alpha/beta hydrolase [Kiritimatiellia bacterium]|nr:alpha/beta hydrolase [Kiritimatiellia bacterium]
MTTLIIIAILGVLYLGVRWFEWSNAFKPSKRMDADPSSIGLEFEDVIFYAEDGCRLHGWWLPHESARGTVIYCHGNAGNISTRLDVCQGLCSLGLNVFIFDYRGYGKSRGFPTERGLQLDAAAAYEVARARYEDDDNPPVVIYGASLGGSVAAYLAGKLPARGLIIEGGFTSAIDVGERWYPWLPISAIAKYRFDARAHVATLDIPKLFSHSNIDAVIPPDLGAELFKAAANPKRFVPLVGEHGEAGWLDTPHYLTELRQFIDTVLPA